MDASTTNTLLDLNRDFYRTYAAPFAATRRRVQPGVRRLLQEGSLDGNLLDLGCGSGALAAVWAGRAAGTPWRYLGLDSSAGLLEEARRLAAPAGGALRVQFEAADLAGEDWVKNAVGEPWDMVTAFAVLHHLPGSDLRVRILQKVRGLLAAGGWFIHSEWQFQNSPRLWARRQAWMKAGLADNQVEEGDALLDWRQGAAGQTAAGGLRYVHLFSLTELENLAAASSFTVRRTFQSDGEGGRLGLYQVWQAV